MIVFNPSEIAALRKASSIELSSKINHFKEV